MVVLLLHVESLSDSYTNSSKKKNMFYKTHTADLSNRFNILFSAEGWYNTFCNFGSSNRIREAKVRNRLSENDEHLLNTPNTHGF